MKPEFTATCVSVENLDDFIMVGLADQSDGTGDYLIFQRAIEPDEQSIRLGLDRIYAERNDQGFSGYGGIESVSLFRHHLDLQFNDKGLRFMGGVPVMKVSFELDVAVFQQFREGLAACFDGFESYRDEADL